MNKNFTLLTVLFCLFVSTIQAQISVTALSQTYNQDFNTLASAGVTSTVLPSGWAVKGNSYKIGNGASNSGGIYSFGLDTTSTDRALGSVASGSFAPGLYGIQFVNNTGAIITSINVDFNVELWRLGQKPALRLDSIILAYNIGVDSLQALGWTDVPSLVARTPDTSGVLGAINGNLPLNRKQITGTITGLSVSNGAKFWLRWTDPNISGNDDGLGIDDLNISFAGSVAAPCTTPAAAPTSLVLTPSGNSIAGSFTASGSATKYLVVVSSSSSLGQTPTDGVVYAAGTSFGSGTVIQSSAATSFNATGLAGGSQYYFFVFALNDACIGEPFYLTTELSGNTTTTCGEPTTKPTNIQFTFVDNTSIQGKFNKAVPAPAGYVVVFSTSSSVAYPLDSVTYAVGDSVKYTSFKSQVAYVGTDSNFTVSGLTAGTRYYFAVLPYTSCSYGPNYLRTTPLRGDTTTLGGIPVCTEPDTITGLTVISSTDNSITASFTPHSNGADGYVVVYRKSSSFLVGVTDGTSYNVGDLLTATSGTFIDSSYVGYIGTNTTFTLTGLSIASTYYFAVFPYNNTACSGGPNYKIRFSNGINKTFGTTTGGVVPCPAPDTIRGVTVTSTTTNSISGTFVLPAGGADGYVVIYRTRSFLAAPSDSVTYTVGQLITKVSGTFIDSSYVGFVGTNGTNNSFTITGLLPSTQYYFAVIPYKSCSYGPNYNLKIGGSTTTNSNRGIATTSASTGIRNNSSEAEFAMFPNPVSNGILNMKFRNALKEEAQVQIVDIAGRILSVQKINSGNNTHMIDVRNLAKGTYVLNVVYKGANTVSSFVIQ